MDDQVRYSNYQRQQLKQFESLCIRCGDCCGAKDGDPCDNLVFDKKKSTYFCKAYSTRHGVHKTVSGKPFTCVPINEILRKRALRSDCGYAQRDVRICSV